MSNLTTSKDGSTDRLLDGFVLKFGCFRSRFSSGELSSHVLAQWAKIDESDRCGSDMRHGDQTRSGVVDAIAVCGQRMQWVLIQMRECLKITWVRISQVGDNSIVPMLCGARWLNSLPPLSSVVSSLPPFR